VTNGRRSSRGTEATRRRKEAAVLQRSSGSG
jgi:hypothetical protein